MERPRDERVKQVVIAASILLSIAVIMPTALLGWRSLPGLLGEWAGMVVGLMTTPFFMEATFVILGFVTVITLNTIRQRREGDDFVYLEQVTGPDVPSDLPDHAKWAIYKEMPLQAQELTPLARAEGAISIGDLEAASGWLARLNHDELQRPDALEIRLQLARASGLHDLASELEAKISRQNMA